MEALLAYVLYYKALHVVGVVSWFAGLFYIVRLFVYHVESRERPEPARGILHEQFMIMERRLWKVITVPAMIITILFGIPLAFIFWPAPWLLVKLGLVVVLIWYHHVCGRILRQLAAGTCTWTSYRLRLWNELATLLMVAIVMLVVLKSMLNALWASVAFIAFGVVLGLAVRFMRHRWAKTAT